MQLTPGFRRRALAVALATIYNAAPPVLANPSGAQVANGQAVLQTQGSRLTVTNTPGAIINWQSFSVGVGETTYFQQQSATSAVLNRVQAQNPSLKSQIDGTLGSNGRVYLLNPNGIVFGAGSSINTQGFVASTLYMNDDDFKSGKLRFARQGVAGDIQVQGRINAGSGDVYLVAPNVGVDGNAVITTQGGNVILAAGEMVEITGRNLNDITFAVQSKDNQVINLGNLSGGAVGVFAGTLTHSGVIQAQTLSRDGGKLVLKAQGNVTLGAGGSSVADGAVAGGSIRLVSQSGNVSIGQGTLVSAQASPAGSPESPAPYGGDITVRADLGHIAVERGAVVVASGAQGGNINLRAGKLIQEGALRADGSESFGGSVQLQVGSRIIQTASAVVSATGVLRGGDIRMAVDADPAGDGNLFTSATINVSASTGVGGSVTITGRDLSLAAAKVLSSGDTGGGSIRIGGGRAGADTSIANAQSLEVSAATELQANARVDGNGGTVITWADGNNRVAGNLEARGGAHGGNGGFIEASAKGELQFGGTANAGAPHGASGTFLLDPKFILIQAPVFIPGVSIELIDPNPGTNDAFGQSMTVLTNGNILVHNRQDDFAGIDSGAVYLYDGTTGALVSSLRGSAAGDQVGSSGSQILAGNRLAVRSPLWNGGAGAFTWGDITSGVSGVVSPVVNSLVGAAAGDSLGNNSLTFIGGTRYLARSSGNAGSVTLLDSASLLVGPVSAINSLVGTSPSDQIGSGGVTTNFSTDKTLVLSPNWNGNRGAVTWFDQVTGTNGPVSAANSLVGSTGGPTGDRVGSNGLSFVGGKYGVRSPFWNNGVLAGAGAVTWVDGTTGLTGPVTATNSLVGDHLGDSIGASTPFILGGSRYALVSTSWNSNARAITWIDGAATPPTGPVDALTNSLVGAPGDQIGSGGFQFTSLSNGKRLVFSPQWNGGKGAVTWFDDTVGTIGTVGAGNSLVGSTGGDQVGGVSAYFTLGANTVGIRSPSWNNGGSLAGAGAVTWADASTGIAGAVTAVNSLVGSSLSDGVGSANPNYLGLTLSALRSAAWSSSAGAITWIDSALPLVSLPKGPINASNSLFGSLSGDGVGSSNANLIFLDGGHYAVRAPNWNGTRGAVTWIDLTAPAMGPVAAGNSLVGSSVGDSVGSGGVVNLFNGKSLIFSPNWNGGMGAVTWFDNTTGTTTGLVSVSNSLVGSTANDRVGEGGYDSLGSKMVIFSPSWNNGGSLAGAGAMTWADPFAGITGQVTPSNSLVGGTAGDNVGANGIDNLDGRFYAVRTTSWANGPATNAGAVTWVDSSGVLPTGLVGPSNSLVGTTSDDFLGSSGVQYLNGPHFAVVSPFWNGSRGAFTWVDLTVPTLPKGPITIFNSLFGGTAGDLIGNDFQDFNGSKSVIVSPAWNSNRGAVTLFDNNNGTFGMVDGTNSLVGSTPGTIFTGDRVGSRRYDNLDGRIAIYSPEWNNGPATKAGAVTIADVGVALTGAVSPLNSLVGSNSSDQVGNTSFQFVDNERYLLINSGWNTNTGAATYVDVTLAPKVGPVDASNSLVGSAFGDRVGSSGTTNYGGKVGIRSPLWANLAAARAGAITWMDPTTGITGPIDANNSLIGSHTDDRVGQNGSFTFMNGSTQALINTNWNAGAGAVTWFSGASPVTGVVGVANSLVGTFANDQIGSGQFFYPNFPYPYVVLRSPLWGGNRGAATWIDTAAPRTGMVDASNSLVGAIANDFIGNNISVLANNDYYVTSGSFGSGAGSISVGSASGGISDVVSVNNSLTGQVAGDGYSVFQLLTGSRLLVRASNADSGGFTNNGRVHIYSGGAGGGGGVGGALTPQGYAVNATQSVTINPGQITAITNNGTSLVLQANTDITLAAASDIVANTLGNSGDLTLQAGRSVLLNSNIISKNGNVTIIANDRVANGVQAANRDAGTAEITMANGTMIDAGTGNVVFQLRDGIGHSGATTANGVITLRSITANNLSVQTDFGGIQVGDPGASAPSLIKLSGNATLIAATKILFAGGAQGAGAELSAEGQITIDPPILEMRTGGSFARIINPNNRYPLILQVADCVTCVFVSPYEITGLNSDLLDIVTASLLSLDPIPKAETTEKSEGDLVVDTGETCQ